MIINYFWLEDCGYPRLSALAVGISFLTDSDFIQQHVDMGGRSSYTAVEVYRYLANLNTYTIDEETANLIRRSGCIIE